MLVVQCCAEYVVKTSVCSRGIRSPDFIQPQVAIGDEEKAEGEANSKNTEPQSGVGDARRKGVYWLG